MIFRIRRFYDPELRFFLTCTYRFSNKQVDIEHAKRQMIINKGFQATLAGQVYDNGQLLYIIVHKSRSAAGRLFTTAGRHCTIPQCVILFQARNYPGNQKK